MGRRLKGRALLAGEDLDAAELDLVAAVQLAEGVRNPPQIWKSHAALGDLRAAQGRADEARQAYRDAVASIDEVAAGLTDGLLRETFLASEHVQGIRDAAMTSG